jgi:two-component system, OmpR family, response regulator
VPILQVLQVEDQDDIRDLVAISLSIDPEIELRAAASGFEALDILHEGYRPHAVLLDVMMPEIDGIETLARMRALPEHRDTPIIFMTARTMQHEKERYLQLGAIGVIPKPFDPASLAVQVRELLISARS